MMKKLMVIITLGLVTVGCLLNGCDVVTGAPSDNTPTSDTEKIPADTIKRIDISAIDFSDQFFGATIGTHSGLITFGGATSLPDGTVLQSQLYENAIPLTWWSDGECQVRNGNWRIEVLFGENGVPEDLKPCSSYFLKIWVKGDPSIIGGMGLATIGPPMIFSFEERNTTEEKITLTAVMTNMCYNISFSGRTQLPDGTLLNAQLYEGVTPVSWWPSDLDIEVKAGEWNINLHLDEIMLRNELSFGQVYTFTIWEKWHPSVSKTAWFDLGSMEINPGSMEIIR